MSGDVTSLPPSPYAFMACTETTLPLYLYFYSTQALLFVTVVSTGLKSYIGNGTDDATAHLKKTDHLNTPVYTFYTCFKVDVIELIVQE